jgi:hypothetical protein
VIVFQSNVLLKKKTTKESNTIFTYERRTGISCVRISYRLSSRFGFRNNIEKIWVQELEVTFGLGKVADCDGLRFRFWRTDDNLYETLSPRLRVVCSNPVIRRLIFNYTTIFFSPRPSRRLLGNRLSVAISYRFDRNVLPSRFGFSSRRRRRKTFGHRYRFCVRETIPFRLTKLLLSGEGLREVTSSSVSITTSLVRPTR